MLATAGHARASAGELDPTFSGDGRLIARGLPPAYAVEVDGQGRIVTVGVETVLEGKRLVTREPPVVARFFPDGRRDRSFGADGKVPLSLANLPRGGAVRSVELDLRPDGGVEIALEATSPSERSVEDLLVLLTADGETDVAFGGGDGRHLGRGTIDSKKRIVYATLDAVHRLLPDGSPDPSFSGDGIVELPEFFGGSKALVGPGDSVLVTGSRDLARLREDGTMDPTFSGDGLAEGVMFGLGAWSIEWTPDGSIYFITVINDPAANVFAYVLQRFGPGGPNNTSVAYAQTGAFAVDPSGRPLLLFEPANGSGLFREGMSAIRFNTDLSRDPSFGVPPPDLRPFCCVAGAYLGLGAAEATAIASAPDGSPVLAGAAHRGGREPAQAIIRLTPDDASDDADLDGRPNAFDDCRFSASVSGGGCPDDQRTLTLRASRNAVRGTVAAKTVQCRTPPTLYRVTQGGDRPIAKGIELAGGDGVTSRWHRKGALRPGRYYARSRPAVAGGRARCLGARSNVVRVEKP